VKTKILDRIRPTCLL